MLKHFAFTFFLLAAGYTSFAQATYFNKVLVDSTFMAADVVVLPDGYIISQIGFFPNERESVFTKLDFNGDTVWSRRYGQEPQTNNVYDMILTRDGNFVASLAQLDSGSQPGFDAKYDICAAKFNSQTGALIWEKNYPALSTNIPRSLIENSRGELLIIGYTYLNTYADFDLLKTDSLGNLLWRRQYGNARNDKGYNLVETPDGGYLLAGGAQKLEPSNDPLQEYYYTGYLVRIDSAGNELWNKRYYFGYHHNDANGIIKLHDGNYLIIGAYQYSTQDFNTTAYLMKINPAGDMIWKKNYSFNDMNSWGPYPIEQPDGSIVGGLWCNPSTSSARFQIMKTDSVGELLWSRQHYYNSRQFNWIYDMKQTADGGFIGVGSTVDRNVDVQRTWALKLDCMGCNGVQCTTDSLCQNVLGTEPLLQHQSIFSFTLYPNPASEQLTLHISSGTAQELVIYNTLGQTVWSATYAQPIITTTINVAALPQGVYLAALTNKQGNRSTQRFVVSR